MRVSRIALAVLAALFVRWSTDALPLVRFGSTAVPGFAVATVAGSLALLAAVVWLMAVRPVLRHPPGSRGVMA